MTALSPKRYYIDNLITLTVMFQITQQLEGICLQVIGTVLQQHVLGKWDRFFHIPPACCSRTVCSPQRWPIDKQIFIYTPPVTHLSFFPFLRVLWGDPVFGSQPDLPAGVATDVAAPSTGIWSLSAGWIWLLHRYVLGLTWECLVSVKFKDFKLKEWYALESRKKKWEFVLL